MKNSLNGFALLASRADWENYQAVIASQLTQDRPDLQGSGSVSFPSEPDSYPCLVASIGTASDPTKANNFTGFKINCCYVYVSDAQQLLAARTGLDHSLIPEAEEQFPLLMAQPEDHEEEESEYAPTHTAVLLLALVNEMEAVGALKRSKLIHEISRTEKWLLDNQESNLDADSLEAVLTKMWAERDAS